MLTTPLGKGGIGGPAASPSGSRGAHGADDKYGKNFTKYLTFNGDIQDTNIEQVWAFPDQCQMLLDAADRLFLSNDEASMNSTSLVYVRLLRRLSHFTVT